MIESNSQKTFAILYQHGRRYVMWKHSILCMKFVSWNKLSLHGSHSVSDKYLQKGNQLKLFQRGHIKKERKKEGRKDFEVFCITSFYDAGTNEIE